MNKVHQIYDKACKRCLSLSKRSTILFINGLYDKDYPLDSEVDYHWTEHNDDDLHRTLADTIITINHTDSYHIEIQMYPDQEIIMRVFEYSYHHAVKNRLGNDILIFPSPKILYLYEDGGAPEYHELTIHFGNQGTFVYQIPTFRYLKMSPEELNQRKLVMLIPFQLLRLRKAINKERTQENINELKYLIHHDIIGTIRENIAVGNITPLDGHRLQNITLQLYNHIYQGYEELEKAGVNRLAEEEFMLDIDIIEIELEKKIKKRLIPSLTEELRPVILQELTQEVTQQVTEQVTQQVTEQVTQQVTEQVTQQVTEQVTQQVTEQVTQQKNETIKALIVQLRIQGVPEETILSITGMSPEELIQL